MTDPALNLTVAGLALLAGLILLWPRRGLLPRWRRARRSVARVLAEDALKHVHTAATAGHPATLESVAGALGVSTDKAAALMADLSARGLVIVEGDGFQLTTDGRDSALHVIRAHRLWELHLADETGLPEAEWHARADEREHALTAAELDALSARLGHPTHDPHGDPIPTAAGEVVLPAGDPLTTIEIDVPLRIVHIEDEPEAVYAQLVAEGLYPGMAVRLTERSTERVRLWSKGAEHVLAPIVAANVHAVPVPDTEADVPETAGLLADLAAGESCQVVAFSPACRGAERRRLMDLGILPGTAIRAEFASPGGDPVAYRVRGAVIALRLKQGRLIHVEPLTGGAS